MTNCTTKRRKKSEPFRFAFRYSQQSVSQSTGQTPWQEAVQQAVVLHASFFTLAVCNLLLCMAYNANVEPTAAKAIITVLFIVI